jgi:hypothetical protein
LGRGQSGNSIVDGLQVNGSVSDESPCRFGRMGTAGTGLYQSDRLDIACRVPDHEQADKFRFARRDTREERASVIQAGGRPATAQPMLLGSTARGFCPDPMGAPQI